jgi:serine/threonine protein phosphatase PrpC
VFYTECNRKFLFGILDGHGRNGRPVGLFCSDFLQDEFKERMWQFESRPEASLESLILDTNKMLNSNDMIDASVSGTTACIVYFDNDSFYVGNVGDSRGLLATTCNPATLT